jgi:hypothetical protein
VKKKNSFKMQGALAEKYVLNSQIFKANCEKKLKKKKKKIIILNGTSDSKIIKSESFDELTGKLLTEIFNIR